MALTIGDLMRIIEVKAPIALKEEWDHPGFELGDKEARIQGIMAGMDVTYRMIDEARVMGANVLLVHHPFLFHPPQTITTGTAKGKKIRALIQNDIAVCSVHTNLDKVRNGMNEKLMGLLGLSGFTNIESDTEEGIGRIADLPGIELLELAKRTERALEAGTVRIIGEADQLVHRVAVINGGGGDFIKEAVRLGADCIITGDTTYHEVLDAREDGIAVIDPGHFHSEWKVFRMFCQEVEEELNKRGEVSFHFSETTEDPFRYYQG